VRRHECMRLQYKRLPLHAGESADNCQLELAQVWPPGIVKSLLRRSGPTTMRRSVVLKSVVLSKTREYGSKAMHPSRIRARISMVWTLSISARKFCCTIHFSRQSEWKQSCSARNFYGRRACQARAATGQFCSSFSSLWSRYQERSAIYTKSPAWDAFRRHLLRGDERRETSFHMRHLKQTAGWQQA
jgi:hypothetical protein